MIKNFIIGVLAISLLFACAWGLGYKHRAQFLEKQLEACRVEKTPDVDKLLGSVLSYICPEGTEPSGGIATTDFVYSLGCYTPEQKAKADLMFSRSMCHESGGTWKDGDCRISKFHSGWHVVKLPKKHKAEGVR